MILDDIHLEKQLIANKKGYPLNNFSPISCKTVKMSLHSHHSSKQ